MGHSEADAMPRPATGRWRVGVAGLCALALLMPACETGGNFTILGYTTRPNYDTRYKTVRVKIFKDPTFWSVVPVPGLEMQLTQAIVREIEWKTPYKVVQGDADTELSGNIKTFTKAILNYNELFEQREVETTLLAEVLWRDLRTGKILTAPSRRPGMPLADDLLSTPPSMTSGPINSTILAPIVATPTSPLTAPAPSTLPVQAAPGDVPPTPGTPLPLLLPNVPPPPWAYQLVRSTAYFRPELGESITTAQKVNVDRMAVQIISAMECPW